MVKERKGTKERGSNEKDRGVVKRKRDKQFEVENDSEIKTWGKQEKERFR